MQHTHYHVSLRLVLFPIFGMMIWYDMIWYDMIWYDMIWYDMIRYDMIWYDMIWYDMIWYDMIWYDTIRYDMIRYDMICSTVWPNCLKGLHLLSVSVCNILIAWYLVRNARSCDVIISLSVSPFRYPLESHRNASSSPISCLFPLLTHWPYILLLSHFLL